MLRAPLMSALIAFALVLPLPLLSHAQSVTTVYGPETFKASLKGETFNKTFKAKSNSDGVLTLVNGDGDDLSQIKCTGNIIQKLACGLKNLARAIEVELVRAQVVEISLNGKKVVTNGNYKSEKGGLQVSIKTLTGQPVAAVVNQLQIKIKGSPLAKIKIDIKAQGAAPVNQPPLAQFTFSPNNSLAPALVSFSGILSQDPDGNIQSYNWNFGDGGTATGSIVTHSYAAAGTYTARLTVTDNQGAIGTLTQVVTVISDATAPTILAINQRHVIGVLPAQINVSLSASEILASATVAGQNLIVNGSQASGLVNISASGNLSLPVVIRDLAGNTTAQNRPFQIILDQAVPVIAINLPSLVNTNQNQITANITVTDQTQVMTTLTLNGVQVLTTGSNQFSYQVDLPQDGEYLLQVTGVDEAGRQAQPLEVTIRRDSVAPMISNVSPAPGAILNSRLVVVTGQVNEAVNITVNGVPAQIQSAGTFSLAAATSGGSFTATVRALADGNYPILIQATDAANNQSSFSTSVMIDTGSDRLWTYEECPVDGGVL